MNGQLIKRNPSMLKRYWLLHSMLLLAEGARIFVALYSATAVLLLSSLPKIEYASC